MILTNDKWHLYSIRSFILRYLRMAWKIQQSYSPLGFCPNLLSFFISVLLFTFFFFAFPGVLAPSFCFTTNHEHFIPLELDFFLETEKRTSCSSHLFVNGSLQLRVASFIELDSWKKVLNQAQEERLILINLINTQKHIQLHKTEAKNCMLWLNFDFMITAIHWKRNLKSKN